ncbi:MAG: Solanesyl diphosphate synthase, partial [uncultured Nocardioides sp.]
DRCLHPRPPGRPRPARRRRRARGAADGTAGCGGGDAGGPLPGADAVRLAGRRAPDGGGWQAVPAAAGAARGGDRRRRRRHRGADRGVRGGADARGLALPRRRHGRGGPAPGGRHGQRPLGQPRRDPDGRLPVRAVLGADGRPRPGGGPDPGADLHTARRGPDPGDRGARPRRRRAGPLPRGRRRQDGLAHRDLREVRRDVRRCPPRGGRGPGPVRRDRRLRLPALRRHPRRELGVGRVRQDAGHRPAGGRADAAGADGPHVDGPGGRAAARAARRRPVRRRPARRGARPAPQAPGDGAGPRLRRRARHRGQGPPRGARRGPRAHRARVLRRRCRDALLL